MIRFKATARRKEEPSTEGPKSFFHQNWMNCTGCWKRRIAENNGSNSIVPPDIRIIHDGLFKFEGIYNTIFSIHNPAARLNEQGIRKRALPFRIDGFNKLVFTVAVKEVIACRGLLCLKELKGLGFFGRVISADADEFKIPFAVHPVHDDEFGKFRYAGPAPGGPYLSLIHISEPTRQAEISYAVFC